MCSDKLLKLIFTGIVLCIVTNEVGFSQNYDVIDGIGLKEHEVVERIPCIKNKLKDTLKHFAFDSESLILKYEHFTYGVKTKELVKLISNQDSLFIQLENNNYLYHVFEQKNDCVLGNYWEILTIEWKDKILFKSTYINMLGSEFGTNDLMQEMLQKELMTFR